MSNANAAAHDAIFVLDRVTNLVLRTGFRLTGKQRVILARWIFQDGERDVGMMADAIICC